MNPLVSVIVTTKNEEKNIRNCLEGIGEQTYPNIEVIVVDNNSTDKTKEIAKKYTKKVYNKGPERSAQRNYGVSKSKGKWILYLDSDMTLTPGVVGECIKTLSKNHKLVGLYIPEKIIGNGFWIKVRDFERSFYDGTVIDCVRFVPKKVFDKVKGFDLTMTGPEDWDFDKKVRKLGDVKVIKSKIYHNEGKFDMSKYIAKKKYYSNTMDAYIRKWGKNNPDVKKQLGGFYRLFGVFVENRKFMKLIMHPLLTKAMYYLRFKVAINYLRR